jgi:small ligand-binding sensory domain FIST
MATQTTMQWHSALSDNPDLHTALGKAALEILDALGGRTPDLVVAFISEHHRSHYAEVPGVVRGRLGDPVVVGCSAGGVIGARHESEGEPAVALTAAVLPGVDLSPFWLDTSRMPFASAPAPVWETALGVTVSANPSFLLIGDPFSFDTEPLLPVLDRVFPVSAKVGGLASGAQRAGDVALFLNDQTYRTGLVGLALSGSITMSTIVAQGCRPIGEPMFVTGLDGTTLTGLDGKTPLTALRQVLNGLSPTDRELAGNSLFLGIAMEPARQPYARGDFVIRNITGLDMDTGLMQAAAHLRENAIVQFHLRDAKTSTEELGDLLRAYRRDVNQVAPVGGLLFSCLGRGQQLYGVAGHDSGLFHELFGDVPLAGFFGNGEIGPVHGETFLHGYTSAFALFSLALHGST